jgi:sulfide:quinone oxidoreductase
VSRTLILGGGFGGIETALELRRLARDDHEILLADRAPEFSMGLRKLWELVGHASIAEGSRPRELLRGRGVEWLQEEVSQIDPEARAAVVGGERIAADHLVVALGAEPRPDLVPGLAEHGHDVWDTAGVPAATEALAAFAGGRIAVLVAGAPYPCPPAPYECTLLVDEHLRARGLREKTELFVGTVQPLLMPNAGREGSAWLGEQLAARGIEAATGRKIERIEEGRIVFADGAREFDLLLAAPPHRAPAVVAASGLGGEGSWIDVDARTLETGFPGVYAVGDVTRIVLANGLMLPKAGAIAELEGARVAAAIAAAEAGEPAPPGFDGRLTCFVELGSGEASLVEGEFYAEPEPRVELKPPSPAHAEEKRRFESERLDRWFG